MVEKIEGVFNAIRSMSDEDGAGGPCTLFLTNTRVIVMETEGIHFRIFIVPIVALVVGLIGLLLRDFVLFFTGITVAFAAGLVIVLANLIIQSRRVSKAKKLAPDEILRVNRQNFEVPYTKITQVELKRFETLRKGSILLPSLPEYNWMVKFATENEMHVFIIKSDVLAPFIKSIQPFVPKIVETEQE